MAQFIIKKDDFQYDVFISHASEDKSEVARPLATSLQELGLRVWYDEFELRIGDDLVTKLNAGINGSRFGIVVLSQAFFAKRWTMHELNMLERHWVLDNRLLFPVWHNITLEELSAYRAWLANIIGLSTDVYTIKEIADELHSVIMSYYAEQQVPGTDQA